MPAIVLPPSVRKEYRAQAHHLDPVVMVGGGGLSDAVVKEVDAALNAHGLIKVRVQSDDREARQAMLQALCERLHAAAVQQIGKLLVLWRPLPLKDKPEPETRRPGPRIVKIVKFAKSGSHRAMVTKVRVMGNERVTAGGLIKRAKLRKSSPKKGAS